MAYRTALITGASSGIGEAIARALPPSTNLLLTGRDRPRLQVLADELSSNSREVGFEAADLSTETGIERLAAWAEPYGPDLLVNNAGFGRFGKALDAAVPEQSDETIVKVNILAPVALTRALAPGMLQRARANGHRAGLLYVASTVAFFPMPYLATYAASKHFLRAYVEAIATELRHEPADLLVLCPGVTRTAWHKRAHMPLPRIARVDEPEEVARAALAAIGRRPVQLIGAQGHLAACLARFLPRRLVMAALGRMAESWG